jgi:hypothetical protein
MERKRRGEESVRDLEQGQDPLDRRRLGSMMMTMMLLIMTTIILSKQQWWMDY